MTGQELLARETNEGNVPYRRSRHSVCIEFHMPLQMRTRGDELDKSKVYIGWCCRLTLKGFKKNASKCNSVFVR